ncbi:DUF960 domain-containing protein [Streptococcus cameli]
MAFTQTKGRYASFGIITSIPANVIDSIWYIIDNYLKEVLPLKHILTFKLKNNKGKISITFSQEGNKNILTVDLQHRFDPFYPQTILIIDRKGKETILLPDELTII